MPKEMNRNSVDDLLIPVQLVVPNGASTDTTQDEVQFQLVFGGLPPRSQPVEGNWITGSWLRNGRLGLLARITIGPGMTLNPGVGRWAVWLRIVDDPTAPVDPVDELVIT